MLLDLAVIFLSALCLGGLAKKLHLPPLIGMLIAGILIGPFCLGLLSDEIPAVAPVLKQLALVIILTRAGLALDIRGLRQVGLCAVLMCFVPACFEIAGVMLLAPLIMGVSLLDAAIMGTVLAAVSPAVIVPKMLYLTDEGYGTDKSIPQMIMAGASADDVFVIALFGIFTSMAKGDGGSGATLLDIPLSVILGVVAGVIAGALLCLVFRLLQPRASVKVILTLSVSFLLLALESSLSSVVAVSGLLAVMFMGVAVKEIDPSSSLKLSAKYSSIWIAAELLLFALVGSSVDISYALSSGLSALGLVAGAMVFRMVGVCLCTAMSPLNLKERIFCMIAYSPKATVQAAIGSVPLAMGLGCGTSVLALAVTAILIAAPLGAIGMDMTYAKLLTKSD